MRKRLFCLAAVLLTAACAPKEEVLVRGEQDMVCIMDGKMLTDNGLTFLVVEEEAGTAGWRDWDRAIISCDLLRQRSATEFEIRLSEANRVLLKDVADDGTIPEEELGDDPVDVLYGWVSGGYLNLLICIVHDPSSDRKHFINLVCLGNDENGLRFRLHHNSYGYYFGAPGVTSTPTLGRSYVSFPVSRFLPAGKENIEFELSWKWHISEAGNLFPETREESRRGVIRR